MCPDATGAGVGAGGATERIVVLGGGQAGGWAALTLRAKGFTGEIELIGEEPRYPYERPPLSKELLRGEVAVEQLLLKAPEAYAKAGIGTHFGRRAIGIDRAARTVLLADGAEVGYDRLLIATGARARELHCAGAYETGVHYLRTIDDAQALRGKLETAEHLTVVGGGLIGMEVAASATALGVAVSVIEQAPLIMSRVLPAAVSDFMSKMHTNRGVQLLTGTGVTQITRAGGRLHITCTGGGRIDTDCVLVGIGSIPNDELARQAGLDVDDGVLVDEWGITSDPLIAAAGDVTRHHNPILGRHIRLESWQNAQNQGIAAAANLVAEPAPYAEIPWSWTDQYDCNLQIAGELGAWEATELEGSPEAGQFTIRGVRDGRTVAVVSVNQPREMRAALRSMRREPAHV